MVTLHVVPDGRATPLLRDVKDDDLWVATEVAVAGIPRGMESGKPAVDIRLDTREGQVVLGTTSLALFLTAADTLKARYGDPRL